MIRTNKFSNKLFIGLMSLGFAGAIAAAPSVSAAPTSGSTGSTTQATPASGGAQGSGYPQTPGGLPVTNPQPQGAERDTAPRTPADAVENNQNGSMQNGSMGTPSMRGSMGTENSNCPAGSSSMSTPSTMSRSTGSASMPSGSAMGTGSSTTPNAATNLSCNVPTNGSSGFDNSGATPSHPVR